MNDEAAWHNVSVYYYDDQGRDDLILDCVRPLFASLRPRPAFFLRHWLRGSHLRLRFHTTADDFDREVRPAVADQVGGWLAEHPSTASPDVPRLTATHEWLARREREPGPLSPLHPDNSIQYPPCDRRIEAIGGETAAALLEGFHVDTTDATFAMLDHIRGGTSRLNLALDLMWASARAKGSVKKGYVSYRSHSEAKIMTAPDPTALRSFFDQQYGRRRAELQQRLGQVLGALDGARDDVPFVREWLQVMTRLRATCEPLIADGAVTLATREPGAWFSDEVVAHSAFHRELAGNPAYLEMMRTNVRFQVFRVMVNCTYLHLNRLGIRPFERSLLGFLASETAEERFGVSAVETVTAS